MGTNYHAFACSRYSGLFYTEDLVLDDTSDPIWQLAAAITTGGSTAEIHQFAVDRNDPSSVQVAVLHESNPVHGTAVYLRQPLYSASWELILTPNNTTGGTVPNIADITGSSFPLVTCVEYNYIREEIYVLAYESGLGAVWFLKRDLSGGSWSYTTIEDAPSIDASTIKSSGGISVSYGTGTYTTGDVIYVGWSQDNYSNRIAVSTDAGASFGNKTILGGGQHSVHADPIPDPSNQGTCFSGKDGFLGSMYKFTSYLAVETDLSSPSFPTGNIYNFTRPLWINQSNNQEMWVEQGTIDLFGSQKYLAYTSNGGSSWTRELHDREFNAITGDDNGHLLIARIPTGTHRVVSTVDNGATFYEKSGPAPGAGIGTSLPIEPISLRGLWLWEGPPSESTVNFSKKTYTVDEDAGSKTITILLSPDQPEEVKVDYATSDGTATAPDDYISNSGVAVFDPGETSKTFDVTIIDDSEVEGNETVILTLSNVVGNASIGGNNPATLIIIDDDVPSGMPIKMDCVCRQLEPDASWTQLYVAARTLYAGDFNDVPMLFRFDISGEYGRLAFIPDLITGTPESVSGEVLYSGEARLRVLSPESYSAMNVGNFAVSGEQVVYKQDIDLDPYYSSGWEVVGKFGKKLVTTAEYNIDKEDVTITHEDLLMPSGIASTPWIWATLQSLPFTANCQMREGNDVWIGVLGDGTSQPIRKSSVISYGWRERGGGLPAVQINDIERGEY